VITAFFRHYASIIEARKTLAEMTMGTKSETLFHSE
jgi:hypothetical protein